MRNLKSVRALVLLGAIAFLAAPAQAGIAVPTDSAETVTFVSPVTGRSWTVPVVQPGGVTTYLNPVTIGLCNAGLGDTEIASWKTSQFKTIYLRCGDSKSGYVHIRARHEMDWKNKLTSTGGSGNWDDFMLFATSQAISGPTPGYPTNEGSNKWCYTTPIQIKKNGVVINTFRPTIIVSSSTKRVLTSYPTGSAPNCSGSQD